MYQDLGYATFELNSFKSRNITSTVGTQNEITMATMIVDAYKALEKLSNHPQNHKRKSFNNWMEFRWSCSIIFSMAPIKKQYK